MTVRSSASSATTSVLDTIGITARSLSATVGSAGRMADAMYAKSDAYATEIEAKALAQKAVAETRAEANFIIEHAEFLKGINSRMSEVNKDDLVKAQAVWDSLKKAQ